ncbi:hypothetical protein DL546_002256 [Coniochaeta pulveracea]|uniref:DH domain-containing protein n=1 Tax=Coniochaeta pulveracea TaxID=177199 RepID=A0A420Y447_9PEZI|nr:hypothetical protein DL546_002256 [Coniochaeta pulveracea]
MDAGHDGEENRSGPATLSSPLTQPFLDQQQSGHQRSDHRLPILPSRQPGLHLPHQQQQHYHQRRQHLRSGSYEDAYGSDDAYENGYQDAYEELWPQTAQHTRSSFSYAQATNLKAFRANASAASAAPVANHYTNASSVDPDDFYRNYREGEASNVAFGSALPAEDALSMASASTVTSGRQLPPGRTNNNGTSSRHLAVSPPSGRSTGARPGFRSVSNPVDNRNESLGSKPPIPPAASYVYSGVAHRSVRDLTKKFDRQTSTQTSPTARKPVPIPRNTSNRDDKNPYTTPRTGVVPNAHTPSRIPAARSASRQKSLPEDHVSSNARSFASRISKPGSANAIATNAQASKSMTYLMGENISPISPSDLVNAPPLPKPPSLLFGEILPEQSDSQTAGYGIAMRIKGASRIQLIRPRRRRIGLVLRLRLNAYVTPNAAKLSPSLRSSRPRQSVALATTASSRMRAAAAGQPQSPIKAGSRATSRGPSRIPSRAPSRQGEEDPSTTRRRKISVGPIDFAQRRETIKLAYSKSIKETRAQQARREAAEKRTKELETVARTKVEAEAVVNAALAVSQRENTEASRHTRPHGQRRTSNKPEAVSEVVPLTIVTDLPSVEQQRTTQGLTSLDSPTLGMPGGFPGGADDSPGLQRQPEREEADVPQSAISLASIVTEFDTEPQTEPATQEAPVTLPMTTAIDADLGIINEQPVPEDADAPQAPQIYQRASYHYPFEEETSPNEQLVGGSFGETSSAQLSPEPTPTLTEFEPEQIVPAAEPQDEYEVRPYIYPSPTYQTTVTILHREPDFIPLAMATEEDVKPDPHTVSENQHVPVVTDQYREPGRRVSSPARSSPAPDVNNMEGFYAAPRLRDNIAALRNSTISCSDREDSLDGRQSTLETHRTPDTSHSLTVPPLHAPGQRLSSASNWTDFSFGSVEDPDVPTKGYTLASRGSEYGDRRPAKPYDGLPSAFRDATYEDVKYSIEISPRDATTHLPRISSGSMPVEPRLPELDTGEELFIPYLSRKPSHENELVSPLPPDHEPPPIPDEYDLDENAYYNDTRPSSYLIANDDDTTAMPQPFSTPPCFEKVSMERTDSQSVTLVPSQPSVNDLPGLSEKEKKRLKQRQMVIKELIDTEDTFIRDMSVVEEIYKGTAEACPNLDAQTVKIIFRNTNEIIDFHTAFLAQLKEGVSSVYVAKGRRSPLMKQESTRDLKDSETATLNSVTSSGATSLKGQPDDSQDRKTSVGPVFARNIDKLRIAHEGFLRTSDTATKRLIQIQEDDAVKVWLSECNEVAKELTTAWNLDSLLIKPMQRITKYPNLIGQLLEHTPADHPDREALVGAKSTLENAILDINKTKKNFELVGQIVGRKRKESDVKAGIARAFGKRVDKLQAGTRIPDDPVYLQHKEKFGDDYLRLQVVLRDVEYYTRTVSSYVHEFLQYLSSMELVMRLQPSKQHGHLESKWVQFNVSMRDIEKVLEQHLLAVRKDVIEPFEQVIRCYGNPGLAMKKREKRRLDYEKAMQLKNSGKKVDKQLAELVEHYEALNETLKKELPKLSALTAKMGNICLGKFVACQTSWYATWKEKVKMPLQDTAHVPTFPEIISSFQTDFRMMEEEAMTIGILNPSLRGRTSQSTADDASSTFSKTRSRPGGLTPRNRGLSLNSDSVPSLPTPDFAKRNSASNIALSPGLPSPSHAYYRDYYAGINSHSRGASSPVTPNLTAGASNSWSVTQRPSTGRSYEPSNGMPRQSTEFSGRDLRRESSSTYNSPYPTDTEHQRRFSGLFHSALPPPDGQEESQRGSRASSRERRDNNNNSGYNILWLAASLFEFNIETTKHEAGYPYLTYQAGEIFDVIAEKGELWLAKNQDDPRNQVGWIWSKHFAKLADS